VRLGLRPLLICLLHLGRQELFLYQFFLLHDDVSHAPFSTGISAASGIVKAD